MVDPERPSSNTGSEEPYQTAIAAAEPNRTRTFTLNRGLTGNVSIMSVQSTSKLLSSKPNPSVTAEVCRRAVGRPTRAKPKVKEASRVSENDCIYLDPARCDLLLGKITRISLRPERNIAFAIIGAGWEVRCLSWGRKYVVCLGLTALFFSVAGLAIAWASDNSIKEVFFWLAFLISCPAGVLYVCCLQSDLAKFCVKDVYVLFIFCMAVLRSVVFAMHSIRTMGLDDIAEVAFCLFVMPALTGCLVLSDAAPREIRRVGFRLGLPLCILMLVAQLVLMRTHMEGFIKKWNIYELTFEYNGRLLTRFSSYDLHYMIVYTTALMFIQMYVFELLHPGCLWIAQHFIEVYEEGRSTGSFTIDSTVNSGAVAHDLRMIKAAVIIQRYFRRRKNLPQLNAGAVVVSVDDVMTTISSSLEEKLQALRDKHSKEVAILRTQNGHSLEQLRKTLLAEHEHYVQGLARRHSAELEQLRTQLPTNSGSSALLASKRDPINNVLSASNVGHSALASPDISLDVEGWDRGRAAGNLCLPDAIHASTLLDNAGRCSSRSSHPKCFACARC